MVNHLDSEAREETIIEEMIARLKSQLPHIDVTHFPDNSEHFEFIGDCVLLVRYVDTDFNNPLTLGELSQQDTSSYEITVLTRSLYGNFGALRLLKAVANIIQGHQFFGSLQAQAKKAGFVQQEPNAWRHEILFELSGFTTQPVTQEPNYEIDQFTLEGVNC